MGRVDKGVKCSVYSCTDEATRSLSIEKAKSAGFNVEGSRKRAYLCKGHYKDLKKKTKKDKLVNKWRHGAR